MEAVKTPKSDAHVVSPQAANASRSKNKDGGSSTTGPPLCGQCYSDFGFQVVSHSRKGRGDRLANFNGALEKSPMATGPGTFLPPGSCANKNEEYRFLGSNRFNALASDSDEETVSMVAEDSNEVN